MTSKEIAELREWAVKKAAMYDRKRYEYAHQYSAEVNLHRYELVIELCDNAMKRRQVRPPYSYLVNQPQGRAE